MCYSYNIVIFWYLNIKVCTISINKINLLKSELSAIKNELCTIKNELKNKILVPFDENVYDKHNACHKKMYLKNCDLESIYDKKK